MKVGLAYVLDKTRYFTLLSRKWKYLILKKIFVEIFNFEHVTPLISFVFCLKWLANRLRPLLKHKAMKIGSNPVADLRGGALLILDEKKKWLRKKSRPGK